MLLELADAVMILINTGPSNVKSDKSRCVKNNLDRPLHRTLYFFFKIGQVSNLKRCLDFLRWTGLLSEFEEKNTTPFQKFGSDTGRWTGLNNIRQKCRWTGLLALIA